MFAGICNFWYWSSLFPWMLWTSIVTVSCWHKSASWAHSFTSAARWCALVRNDVSLQWAQSQYKESVLGAHERMRRHSKAQVSRMRVTSICAFSNWTVSGSLLLNNRMVHNCETLFLKSANYENEELNVYNMEKTYHRCVHWLKSKTNKKCHIIIASKKQWMILF